jgi:transposase
MPATSSRTRASGATALERIVQDETCCDLEQKGEAMLRQLCPADHWCSLAPALAWARGGHRSLVSPLDSPRSDSNLRRQLGPENRLTPEVSMKKRILARRKRRKGDRTALEAIRPMVAGVDIGSEEHWVCGPERDDGERLVRVFRATTAQLRDMAAWLLEQGVESVAMESTYLYWIPVYEVLEAAGLDVVLVNARMLHNVPGRKTDLQDCQWLQRLHSCGLLRGSFRPRDAICRLRALQRQRANLVETRSRFVQWMQKALDQMNVRVHRAVSDLTGHTGMAIVRAIVAGERDPLRLAALRDKACRKSVETIAEHLAGNWREEHVYNLSMSLRLFDETERAISEYDQRLLGEIEGLQPDDRRNEAVPAHPNAGKERVIRKRGHQELRQALWRFANVDLTTIDGISAHSAQVILTEVGADLTAFPSENHFASWLRLCPRKAISGGKPLKKRPNGTGASRIAGALRTAAVSIQRSKTALGAAYRRTARYKGAAVAVFSIARKLALYVYRLLRHGSAYIDIGEAQYEARFRQRQLHALTETAKNLGFTLVAAAESPP